MSIVRDNAFGYELGQGVDGGTGSVRGVAVTLSPPAESDEGQVSSFLMKKIETFDDLTTSLQIKIDGDAEFCMFGGSDKFSFVENQKIHSYHLYLFIRTNVLNAPVLMRGSQLTKSAFDLLATGDKQRFHEEFGDFFVMGRQTGGEFAALLDIHTSNATEHQNLSNEVDAAGFGGGFAFAADAKIAFDKVHDLSVAEIDITEFQVGGLKDDTPVTAASMIDKAVNFRKSAGDHGVTCKVLLQDYLALDLPPNPTFVDLQNQKDTLEDCFRQRNRLQKNLNDVEFISSNPDQFVKPAPGVPGVNLNAMRDDLAAALNAYSKEAAKCIRDFRACALVTPAPPVPDLNLLPARKDAQPAQPELVVVPNWVGFNINDFRDPPPAHPDLVRPEQIGLGLVFRPVASSSGDDGEIVSQNPPAGASVPRGSAVVGMAIERTDQ